MKTTLRFLIFGLFLLTSPALLAQVDDDADMSDQAPIEEVKATSAVGLSNYRMGEGVTFRSRTDSYSLNISGFIQNTMELTNYNDVDPAYDKWDKDYLRFRVRRARIRINGSAYGGQLRYRLGADMVKGSETSEEGGGATLSDAFVQWRPQSPYRLIFTFGQRFSPTDNKESFMSSLSSEFAEKSKVTSAFATNREVGLFAEARWKIGRNQYINPHIAITDGSGPISSGKRYGGVKTGVRVNYLPTGLFRAFGETRMGDMAYEIMPKLAIGAAYSYASRTADRRGGGGGPFLYKSHNAQANSGDTDENLLLPDFSKASADIVFKYRGFAFLGEYVKTWANVSKNTAYRVYADRRPALAGFNNYDDGTGASTGADPVEYIKNRMVLGSGLNVQGSYMLRSFWDFAVRYTHLNPDKFSYLNNKTFYGRDDWYTVSVTKWMTNSYASKIQISYAMTKPNGGYGRIVQDTTSPVGPPDTRAKFYGWESHLWIMFQLAF